MIITEQDLRVQDDLRICKNTRLPLGESGVLSFNRLFTTLDLLLFE